MCDILSRTYRPVNGQKLCWSSVKGGVRMMEIRWMNSDVNRPSGVDEGRRRR